MQDTLMSLKYRVQRYNTLKNRLENIKSTVTTLTNEKVSLTSDLKTVNDSSEYYKKSQDILYAKSIGSLKNLIDSALKFIFFDKRYEIIIDLTDKRGTKNLSFRIRDIDEDFEVSLKNGCGNGVRSVISAILNIFVLLNKDSNILILDEKYSHISAEYVENFFAFLEKICDERQMIIVMITHDVRFATFSKKSYRISDGRVEEIV
jgi:DNA repair exonuclease SbcCD ATPase subunit